MISIQSYKSKSIILLFFILIISSACDDKITWQENGDSPVNSEISGMYILCEGLFNMNNSTISYYDFTKGEMLSFQDPDKKGSDKTSFDYFKMQNGRKLGDTANDLKRYGSKLWCAVNVSSQIEVMELNTGKALKQIPLFDNTGVGREPRYFAFHQGKAYVCSFDGTVARIDTTTLEVEAYVKVGRNPDGICVANQKLYVSNSGGLNQNNPDNTVSVIDINSFKEIKKIEVRNNLGTIQSDASGNVYVVSREKFNYETNDYDCQLHRIDSETDKVIRTYEEPVLSFIISGHQAYMYSYNSQKEAIRVMDTRTGLITDDNFIKDETSITRIYNITVNPINNDVYICDAQNYVINGSILCFDQNGKHKFTIDAKGINPNAIVFTETNSNPTDVPDNGDGSSNYINKVWSYKPAPGQFINQLPPYTSGDTEESMQEKCLRFLNQGSLISLGGFGGQIIVGMNQPIKNVSGEYDFQILGNAFAGSAEPGIVCVSEDTNRDGIPNDNWYEIKGSAHDDPRTMLYYTITYYKPAKESDKVAWSDWHGNGGYIDRTIHQQNYYPLWLDAEAIAYTGTRLPDNGTYDTTLGKWIMSPYQYGYADNRPDNSEGSKLKIDWAINEDGNSVHLEQIDFIKIYTAINQSIAGGIGEISTEVRGIEDLHF